MFMKKIDIKLNDKTNKLNKKDYIIMGIVILIYSIISFYRLGDMSAPNTYYTFSDINDSVVVDFGRDVDVAKIRYWTGINIGELGVMIRSNNGEYHDLKDITTYSVLSWEDSELRVTTSSIKFVAKSYGVTLGDIAIYDYQNNRVMIGIDQENPMLDETDLVPETKSYMNSLYFDEIYHARSAYEYVNGIDCFEWSHPPLGKLIMAFPLLIFGYSPFTVRLMGNLAGILLIPVMYILCKKIFKNRIYALLGALLMMFDNMHFAHTRIALVDGFEVLFILLSVLFMVDYLSTKKTDSFKRKTKYLLLSGTFIGCAIATKWNAGYAAIGLAIVFFIHLAKEYNFSIKSFIKKYINLNNILKYLFAFIIIPLCLYYLFFLYFNKNIAGILLTIYLIAILILLLVMFIKYLIKDKYMGKLFLVCVISFIIIPVVIYILSYVLFPNVAYYDKTLAGIIDQTKLMYDYHSGLDATHPFSSTWYSWPIMYKPVWIYSGDVINNTRETIVDIGNPAIWWFGIVSFVYLVISVFKKNKENLFVLIFILSTLVPYIFIGRIMFMYHYFIVLPFVMMSIVAFIKWITEKYKTNKVYWLYVAVVVVLFFVFYPVTSGMRVAEDYIESLKWFSSWWF